MIVLGAWLAAMSALAVLAHCRYRWPRNLLALSVFTLLISNALALTCGPNVIFGLALATGAMILVAVPACIRLKDKMIEVMFAALIAAPLMLIMGIAGWLTIAPHIHARWVLPTLLLNAAGVVWLGYEMDWICSRLNPDEFLLPICLVWSEIFTALFVVTLLFIAGNNSACNPDGCFHTSVIYCHCNCWLYESGDSSRKQYFRNLKKFEARSSNDTVGEGVVPPRQESMQQSEA